MESCSVMHHSWTVLHLFFWQKTGQNGKRSKIGRKNATLTYIVTCSDAI
jgi:hypothetical protein